MKKFIVRYRYTVAALWLAVLLVSAHFIAHLLGDNPAFREILQWFLVLYAIVLLAWIRRQETKKRQKTQHAVFLQKQQDSVATEQHPAAVLPEPLELDVDAEVHQATASPEPLVLVVPEPVAIEQLPAVVRPVPTVVQQPAPAIPGSIPMGRKSEMSMTDILADLQKRRS